MRPRTVVLPLALSLAAIGCPSKPDSPPTTERTEQAEPFEDPVDRATVPTAPELGDPPPLRLAVRTTALDLDSHGWKSEVTHRQASAPELSRLIEQFEREGGFVHEYRGISRAVTSDVFADLQPPLGDLADRYRDFAEAIGGEPTTPILGLDLEGAVRMEIVHRVIRTASGVGIDEFVALVQTSAGPGRIPFRYGRPKPGSSLLASPHFGLSASFTSAGAFMTLGATDSGVPRALANPSGACPTVPASNGVLDPALVVERISELPPEVRTALAFRFADDMTWSQAAPILAAIAAAGIDLDVSRMRIWTDCDEPFVAADYRPPEPDGDEELDDESTERVVVDGVQLGEPSLEGDGLPPDIISRIIEAHRGELAICRRKAVAADPMAHGTLTVVATIDAKGKIREATVTSAGLSTKTVACVDKAFERWTFPKPSDAAPLTFAIDLAFGVG